MAEDSTPSEVMGAEPMGRVSRTSIGVAGARARETDRPDRLFDDPYATDFVMAFKREFPGEPISTPAPEDLRRKLAFQISIRTRFYDDYLRRAASGGIRQIVLVAAGLDARALRLDWPASTKVFELDLPPVLDFKERVLAKHATACDRRLVPVDLREDWPAALAQAGFDPVEPAAWLTEGLLVYLTKDQARLLLERLDAVAAPGSTLGVERRSRASYDGPKSVGDELTPLWQGGLGRGTAPLLRDLGWSVVEYDLATVAAELGRPIGRETEAGFLIATKGEAR